MNHLDLLNDLKETSLFKDWKDKHQQAFLSHFFCQINSNLEQKFTWEIGFYDKEKDKVTTFIKPGEEFQIKNEDEVFKKETDTVEELNLDQVKIELVKAKKIINEELPKLFPNEERGDGFLILQTIKQETTWNFTLITKALKLINIKINSENGEVVSHQVVELLQKN